MDDLGWLATGSDVNQLVTILERSPTRNIEWASSQGLQFHTAEMKAVLFTCRRGSEKHLRPNLTAMIWVGDRVVWFHTHAICWLDIWMDEHLTFKEQHNRCMKKSWAADARLRTHTETYGCVPGRVRALQAAYFQAIAIYGCKLWWGTTDVGRQDNLQLQLNRQATSILGMLPMTLCGALIGKYRLTHVLVILDSRQLWLAGRLPDTCGSKLKALHSNPSCNALICRVVKKEHEEGRITKGINWPAPGEESVVRTPILNNATAVNNTFLCLSREKEDEIGATVWMWLVLAAVLNLHFGSGSGWESNSRQICGLGQFYTQTVNSGTVGWTTPNPSELGGLSVGCPAGPSVHS